MFFELVDSLNYLWLTQAFIIQWINCYLNNVFHDPWVHNPHIYESLHRTPWHCTIKTVLIKVIFNARSKSKYLYEITTNISGSYLQNGAWLYANTEIDTGEFGWMGCFSCADILNTALQAEKYFSKSNNKTNIIAKLF